MSASAEAGHRFEGSTAAGSTEPVKSGGAGFAGGGAGHELRCRLRRRRERA
jgi:hypothetical protein